MNKNKFNLKKNIFQSLIFKVIAMVSGVILVPIVLHYLGKEKYGIWVTLTVVFNWFGFFDFGIGNGLRNKLSEANAKGNFKLAKELVSTSYVLISLIFFFLFAIIVILSPFANWYKIFNIGSSFNENFNLLILFLAGGFSFSFILRLLAPIFFANQHAARKYMADTIGTVISFVLIVTVTKIVKDSLSFLLIIYVFSPLVVYGLASIYFFNKDYKAIKPSFKSINFKLNRSIVGMGTQFLIIQLSALFLQSSIFFLINFFVGSGKVAEFNVAFKYFMVVRIGSQVFYTPYWSAVTDAYSRKDKKWLINSFKKTYIMAFLFIVGLVIMYLMFRQVSGIWIHQRNFTSPDVLLGTFLYVVIFTLTEPIMTFINGIGELKEQFILSIFVIMFCAPLSIALFKYTQLGVLAFILVPALLRLIKAVAGFRQLGKIYLLKFV